MYNVYIFYIQTDVVMDKNKSDLSQLSKRVDICTKKDGLEETSNVMHTSSSKLKGKKNEIVC